MTFHLVIDTATRRTVVAIGDGLSVLAQDVLDAPNRHGTQLMSRLDGVLSHAGIGMADVSVIGVGTGPGSFTGLRVGLATAKTLAALRHLTLVGLPTDDALRRAAWRSGGGDDVLVVLPAGARDHYLAVAGSDPELVPPGADLAMLVGGRPLAVVDVTPDAAWLVECRANAASLGRIDPVELGRLAGAGMPRALLELLDERLAGGVVSDAATLVPRYVALPRGIPAAAASVADAPDAVHGGEGTWSPGSR